MKPHIIQHPIKTHSPEWYKFRLENGIGGSETGVVMGISPYKSRIRMFHEKIGTIESEVGDTEPMLHGRNLEDYIADCWQYWDGTKEGWLKNITEGNKIRKARRINGYLTNSKYPFMYASVDRVMNINTGVNLLTGTPITSEVPIECKQLSYFAAKKWEGDFPPYYVMQLMHYMIVLEEDYGEFAVLKDGNKFEVYPVERNDSLCERIIEENRVFWQERVLPVRALMTQGADQMEIQAAIQRHEPDPDTTEDYEKFMKENWQKQFKKVIGTKPILQTAIDLEIINNTIKALEEQKQLKENYLHKAFNESGAEMIDFEAYGHVKYVKRGKSLVLDRRLKSGIEKDSINDKVFDTMASILGEEREKITYENQEIIKLYDEQ